MGDIDRRPTPVSVDNVHLHNCPNCLRDYSCNCHAQPTRQNLTCIDCERGTYNPVIHGGKGHKEQA